MMVKIFTTDRNDGRILLTKEELQALLNEAYQEGRMYPYTISTFNTKSLQDYTHAPYYWTTNDSAVTLCYNNTSEATFNVSNN